MCGIAGIYSLNQTQKIDLEVLQEMTRRVRHRGPNDEGLLAIDIPRQRVQAWSGKDSTATVKSLYPRCDPAYPAQLGLGFRRLPIVELSESGHQPMYDAELGLALVFNGEIYNHPELRRELEAKGYSFFSGSDTEVILKAYHAWGEACVQHLIGMWAFSLWDLFNQSLFLSRDRFGIKPLYYALDHDFLYWGSEIKQMLAAPISRAQNHAMIWRSMKVNAMMVYDDETYWQEIKALKPGHNLLLDGSGMQIKEYYALDPQSFEQCTLSFDQATARYRELFLDSLQMHLRGDVEIAAALSGGLDSSAIACMAAPTLSYPLQTFSTYYEDDPALDERAYIEIIAAKSNIRTNYIAPRADDALSWWQRATYLNDLPIASGFVSQYALMQKVHEAGMRVLLSGQGSDEMSGGYRHASYRYFADLLRGLKVGRFGRDMGHFLQANPLKSLGNLGKIALSVALPESRLYALEARSYRFEPFSKEFCAEARQSAEGNFMSQISDLPGSRLSSFLFNMMQSTSLLTLLHFEDRMSMAHSVESRVPFLDHRLVEFVFSLPSVYKIQPPLRKVIHRAALRDCVPQEIAARKDKGIFGSPFYRLWMSGELKHYIQDILYSPEFRNRGIWDLPRIHNRWQRFLSGSDNHAEMLYNVVSLELWHRSFAKDIS
jgi:asparagine synthase (glutamine-hydrolysing)